MHNTKCILTCGNPPTRKYFVTSNKFKFSKPKSASTDLKNVRQPVWFFSVAAPTEQEIWKTTKTNLCYV